MPEKLSQTLDINQDNKLDIKDVKKMEEIMKTVKDSPEGMNQYIGALNEQIDKLDIANIKNLRSACLEELNGGKELSQVEKNKILSGTDLVKKSLLIIILKTDGKINSLENPKKEEKKDNGEKQKEILTLSETRQKIEKGLKKKNNDVTQFLDDVFGDKLEGSLSDFNEKNFSNLDKKEGFSEYELKEFKTVIDKAIKRMNLLGSYEKFKETHEDADDDSLGWSNGDKFLAKRLELNTAYIPGIGNVNVTEKIFDFIGDGLSDLSNISKEELHRMREEKFDITSMESMKDFAILLGIEIGEGLEDMVKLILNIGAGVTLAPRYIANKTKIEGEIDTEEEAKLIIENERLLKENPSLALIELASNGMEILGQMWEKMKSGTNGVVAMGVVSIAGLIAGGAGAVKFLGKMSKTCLKSRKNVKIRSSLNYIGKMSRKSWKSS